MATWRTIVCITGLIYILFAMATVFAVVAGTPSLTGALVAAVLVFLALCVLAAQSKAYGRPNVRLGAMIFLLLFIPLFGCMAGGLWSQLRLVIAGSAASAAEVWTASGLLVACNILAAIGIHRLGKIHDAERRDAKRRRRAARHAED